ncbi:hypothetical protein GOP47_0021667 [Adiantum capillus-veneris]|uniref:Kinesin motor domain-containing protein n=1 Tax=Adiantum capillus-veneris TaxID=13818 RepID=A0A9D4U8K1_ADICA|nr:hypothetical protein GOP47_0021667 [Adiantum capillus-veneris]
MSGSELAGKRYQPLFYYFLELFSVAFKVLSDEYVKDDSGTGIVHCAPAFGEDDYRVCLNAVIIASAAAIQEVERHSSEMWAGKWGGWPKFLMISTGSGLIKHLVHCMQGACSDEVKQGSDGIGDTTAVHTGKVGDWSGGVVGSGYNRKYKILHPLSRLDSSPTTPRPKAIPTTPQKRVYEVVAKPMVESVLEGYNGTIMAYGQTGTSKTFTLGKLGEEDAADRGIMVRAMEDILADTSSEQGSVTVSDLQVTAFGLSLHWCWWGFPCLDFTSLWATTSSFACLHISEVTTSFPRIRSDITTYVCISELGGNAGPHSVTITEFSAVGDGVTINTHAFTNAIFYLNSFEDKGGAQLYVPAGRWLTGSFKLISHLTLFLDKEVVMLGSQVCSFCPIPYLVFSCTLLARHSIALR